MKEIGSIFCRDNDAAICVLTGETDGPIRIISSWSSSPKNGDLLAVAAQIEAKWDLDEEARRSTAPELREENILRYFVLNNDLIVSADKPQNLMEKLLKAGGVSA